MIINKCINLWTQGVTRTFEGCLRNVRMGPDKIVDLSYSAGTSPCSEKIEEGVFFSADGGYIKTGNFNYLFAIFVKVVTILKQPDNLLCAIFSGAV